jgi:hypothetical protein
MTDDTQHYDIVEHTLEAYTKELTSRILDGWIVSNTCPGEVLGFYGSTFTVSLYRNASTVDWLRSKIGNVAEQPKPTRAEILQKARDAKAARKTVGKATK